jgi:hypothetical protein
MVVLKENKINHLLDNQHLNLSSGLDSLNCNTCAAVPSSWNYKCLFTLEWGLQIMSNLIHKRPAPCQNNINPVN